MKGAGDKILVTGFEAYGGRKGNPSADIARALHGKKINGRQIYASVLPVVNDDLPSSVRHLVESVNPTAIVALGLCPGEAMIRLERLAANYSCFEIPDNAGAYYRGPVVAGAPAAYESTLPLDLMQTNLLAAGIPARLSNTAGTYLCNALMFQLLHYCSTIYEDRPCGFIHLPLVPSQVCDLMKGGDSAMDSHHQSSIASMPLEMQKNAIETAIACINQ